MLSEAKHLLFSLKANKSRSFAAAQDDMIGGFATAFSYAGDAGSGKVVAGHCLSRGI
jgi:hypothetical protein